MKKLFLINLVVFAVVLLPMLKLTAAEPATVFRQPGYAFISCDVDTHEITKFNPAGDCVWIYSEIRAIDVWPMSDGSVLASYLPSPRTNNKGGVRLITAGKKTVFDYQYADEIMSCQPLPNGNILINECAAGRITEIDRHGKSLRS